jgi:hypothetical protein
LPAAGSPQRVTRGILGAVPLGPEGVEGGEDGEGRLGGRASCLLERERVVAAV